MIELLKETEVLNKINIILKLYYNRDEKDFGDGFYPGLIKKKGYESIYITFYLDKYYEHIAWVQKNNSVIYGFDFEYGKDILEYLNIKANVKATIILNASRRVIYPKLLNSTYRILSQL